MGTAFEDLADPETGLVTRERWNSHFGKDDFDKYDQDDSGLMDKDEWNKAFASYASQFLSDRITRFYEGELKTVQKELEDVTEEEQNAYYTMQAMYAEDNYIHTLNEAMLRRTEPTPEEEASMMAEEDRQAFQLSALVKAEQALE